MVSIVRPALAFAQGHLAPSGANFLLISLNSDTWLRLIGILFLLSSVVICRRLNHKNSVCSNSTIDHPHSSGGKREHPVDEVFGRLPLRVEPPTRPVWKSAKASGES